ncbi:hypothetical protein QZH41_015975 [Actinostola sp. cb2023]|nr:hypothetical protein QZH41_015975 [Actinostola sp. cb2023]
MGGQLSVKAKKAASSSHLEESFSCSCSLVCNETFDGNNITPKKESTKRRRKSKGDSQWKTTAETQPQIPRKKLKISMLYNDYETRNSYMAAFFKLLDDDIIQDFLWMDGCAKISDKYLLSMVYAYFRRANLQRREFNRLNFFIALYLANDMEEDEEDDKYDIFPWALGKRWRELYKSFLVRRDIFVMMIVPDHPIWWRERKPHHGGAWRSYSQSQVPDDDPSCSPRGPGSSPVICSKCRAPSKLTDTPTTTSDYSSQSSSEESTGFLL